MEKKNAKSKFKLPADPDDWREKIDSFESTNSSDRKYRKIAWLLAIHRRIKASPKARAAYHSLAKPERKSGALRKRSYSHGVVHLYSSAKGAEKDRLATIIRTSTQKCLSPVELYKYLSAYGVDAFIKNGGKPPQKKAKTLPLKRARALYRKSTAILGSAIDAKVGSIRKNDGPVLILAHQKNGKIHDISYVVVDRTAAAKLLQKFPGLRLNLGGLMRHKQAAPLIRTKSGS